MAVAALVAFLCSLLLTPAVAAIAWRLGAVSHPDGGRRRQPRSTPLWGGLAVLIGLYAGAAVASGAGVIATEDATWTAAILLSAGIICLLGCYDDARAISASSKLAGQLLAIAPLLLAGFHAERLLVFGLEVELGWLGVPLTAAWLILAINALNLLDGMDGLASSTGICVALSIAGVATVLEASAPVLPALLLAAALAGFLFHNFPPARVYLGDAGSLLVGLMLGAMAMQWSEKGPLTMNGALAAILLLLPLADTGLAVVRRLLKQQSLFHGDRGHIHHRLLDRGFSTAQALAMLGGLSLVNGCLAFWAVASGQDWLAWSAVAAGLPLLVYARVLGHEEWALFRRTLLAAVTRLPGTGNATPAKEEVVAGKRFLLSIGEPKSPLPKPHFSRETVPISRIDDGKRKTQKEGTSRKQSRLAAAKKRAQERRRSAA